MTHVIADGLLHDLKGYAIDLGVPPALAGIIGAIVLVLAIYSVVVYLGEDAHDHHHHHDHDRDWL